MSRLDPRDPDQPSSAEVRGDFEKNDRKCFQARKVRILNGLSHPNDEATKFYKNESQPRMKEIFLCCLITKGPRSSPSAYPVPHKRPG